MGTNKTSTPPRMAKAWFLLLIVLVFMFLIIANSMFKGKYLGVHLHVRKFREQGLTNASKEEAAVESMQENMYKQEDNGSKLKDEGQKEWGFGRVTEGILLKKRTFLSKNGNHFSSMTSDIYLCRPITMRHFLTKTDWNITAVKYVPKNPDRIIKNTLNKFTVDEKDRFCSKLNQLENSLGVQYARLIQRKRFSVSVDILASLGYEQRLPNVVGLGVKKTGSTALLFFMDFHPQIRAVSHEVHFFNRDEEYMKGIDYYRTIMKFSKEDDIVFEKSPGYFNESSIVPARINTSLQHNVKFILGVRDPVDRTISDSHHTSFIHGVVGTSLKHCTPISEGKRFVKILFDENDNLRVNHTFIDASNYAHHFRAWTEYFPRERFFVFDEKEMKKNPLNVLKRLEEFLGIDSFFHSDMISIRNGRNCYSTKGAIICPPTWGQTFPKPEVGEKYIEKLRNYFRPLNKEFELLAGRYFQWRQA